MALKKVEFHEETVREHLAAVDWHLARNESVVIRFAQQVARAVVLIAQVPHRWPSYSHHARKFLLRRFPFVVIYRELPTVIQVLAVAHSHRRPGYWKTRR